MLRFAAREDLAGGDVQRRKEVERTVPDVVMCAPLGLAKVHRQDRLRAFEGLDLRFLVERQHDGIRGRIHVQADDVPDLFHELRVGRDFERFGHVRLETERAPDAADGRMAHPRLRRHGPRTPVRFPWRRRFEGFHNHRLDVLIRDRAWRAHPRFIVDAVQPPVEEPLTPLADRRIGGAAAARHGAIRRAVGTRQHQSRAEGQRPICPRSLCQPDQRAAFIVRDDQWCFGASNNRHAPLDHTADPFSS
jgi:hypothetical protein